MRMKRKFTLLLTTLLCLAGMNAWALDQKDGVYQISTAQDLADFAALVNGGEASANAVLLNDIDYTANSVQIGNPTFSGTFDGQGHKVTVDFKGTDTKGVNAALFYKVLGVVKNLGVSGTITSPLDNVASIAFNNYGWIDHCYSDATISSTKTGSCSSAGIVGQCYTGGAITNCFFAGKFTSETATNFAGIMGWSDGTNTVSNCLVVAVAEGTACGNSSTAFARNCSRVDNSYCLYNEEANFGANDYKEDRQLVGSFTTTAEDLASGKIAYLLGWGQDLASEATPNPLSTKKVYPVGSCTEPTGYTNDPAASAHTFDGYKCSVCGTYKPGFMTPVNGVYQIGTADQLNWFALFVNATNLDVDAVLTNDIDMSGVSEWPMIGVTGRGAYYNMYRGTFDGQYHKIKNLIVDMPDREGVGFFGMVGPGSVIKNLFTDETCSFYGFKKIGGIMGYAYGVGAGAPVKLLNLGSAANVAAVPTTQGGDSDAGVGGITGNCAGGVKGEITNCWFEGTVSGASSAFISAWCGSNQFTLTSCWSISESTDASLMSRAGSSGASVKLVNCFAMRGTQAPIITAEDVASGALCFGLNEGIENPAWHQTLGTDPKPTLQGTDFVYKVGTKNCDGTDGSGFGYSNENTGFTQTPHQIDPNTGLCIVCGQWVPAEDGWYEITNIETFLRFAELAKTDPKIKARLTANLDFTGVADDWAPIGGTNTFTGEFDGQNHIISNMVLNQPDKSDFGMFKTGANVVLKNFILDATCSITGAQKVGLIGNHNGGGALFENIGNMANISGEGENVSGFFGGGWSASVPVTINSCWVVGEVVTGNRENPKNPTNCGAFGGWLNSGTFIFNNCWTIAIVPNSTNSGRYFTRHNDSYPPQLNNCYSLFGTQVNTIPGYETANDADEAGKVAIREQILAEVATGGLAYKLNGDQSTITWFQTLGVDPTPVPWSDHGTVYGIGKVNCDGKPLGGTMTYSNNKDDAPPVPDHQFDHGFCKNCGTFDPTYKQPVADFYELADAEDILWFSTLVENGNPNANARLTADIDMTDVNEKYKSFGKKYIYGGTFDGDYHKISNLYINGNDGDNIGFISQVKTGATLKNIIFDASCTIIGGTYVGVIGGSPSGETGEIYMTNVGYEGTVEATVGANAGAIIGCNHGSAALYVMTGCYSTGSISGVKENGALSGWVGSKGGTITKCWSTATVTEYQSEDRYLFRYGSTAPSMSRIYSTMGEQGTIVTDAQMASGEVTFALNNSSFLDATWFQTIGEDLLPTFVPGHGVVYNVNGEIGDVHDSDSYFTLRTLMIGSETEMAESTIATQALLDAYLATVESWGTIETFEDFCIAYRNSQTERDAIKTSVAAYKEYIDACEYAINYLKENDFTNETRTKLEAYLSQNEGPSDEFPNGTYAYVIEKHELTDEEIANEAAFLNIMLQKAITGGVVPGTELTVTLVNHDFKSNFDGWSVESNNGGMAVGGEKSIMYIARGLDTNFTVEQTLEDVPNGIYELRINGFERTAGDDYSQLHTSQLYLNGNSNFVMTINEDVVSKDAAEDGVNCHITGSSVDKEYVYEDIEGYVPGYMIGCSYAYNAGRYLNYTAVEVTDGKLTLGVRNMGSGLSNDWVPFGNVRLFYLGSAEQASESLDNVLDGYVARAEVISNFEWVDTEEAAKYPNMSEALKEQVAQLIDERATVTTGEQKMELVNKFSALFNEVYECRKAYVEMTHTADVVSNNAITLNEFSLIEKDDVDAVMVVYNKAWEAYQDGSVTTDEAKAITAELLAFDFAPARDENGVYQLASARDLGIFALLVNSGQYDADAVLTADIDMQGINYTPIGWNMSTDNSSANTTGALYCGHFDGQGHRISNLIVDKPGSIGVGMFGDIMPPAHIENFVLDATCNIYGNDRAGVIGRAEASGRSGNDRIVTINNVGNEGNVYCDKAPAGILGNANNSSLAIITDCYSTGKITMRSEDKIGTSDQNAALICGWLANLGAQITNCWSTAEITNYQSVDRALCRVGGDNNKFVNCYSTFATQAVVVPAEAFTTGEVAYKLNGGATENVTWYQTIGEDQHPVFAGEGHLVVSKKADGTYYNLEDAIRNISFEVGNVVSVFDAQGRMVRSNVSPSKALQGMTKGMYILKGESKSVKVLVK